MTDLDIFNTAIKLYENKKITHTTHTNNTTHTIPDENACITNTTEKEVCQHTDLISENGIITCQDCCEEIRRVISYDKEWRYCGSDGKKTQDPNRTQPRKDNEKSIRKDVENMGFSEKVVAVADELYTHVTNGQILRDDNRKAVILGCLFRAYDILGIHQPIEPLVSQLGIPMKKALKGLKVVSINVPKNAKGKTSTITPAHVICDIMNKFSATQKQKDELVLLYDKIKNKSTKLNRARTHSVVASLIYYWICQKKIKITLKEYSKKVELTEQTISKLTAEIFKILNPINPSEIIQIDQVANTSMDNNTRSKQQ